MTFTVNDKRRFDGDGDTRAGIVLLPSHFGVERIVSTGQCGADRGALDAAIALGIAHGGWCPLGRLAEDGSVPTTYDVRQTTSEHFGQPQALNVRDSDGTLMVSLSSESVAMSGGLRFTRDVAKKQKKPLLHLQLRGDVSEATIAAVRAWIKRCGVRTLNVSGPRESREHGITEATTELVALLLDDSEGAP